MIWESGRQPGLPLFFGVTTHMRKQLWIPTAAGGAALALVATTGIVTALHKNDVELVVDGVPTSIAVRENTVGEVMELEDITVDEHDVVVPSADTRITDGMEITVEYGRPLTVTVDGEEREVWTTARNVGDALAFLDLDDADSKLSTSRSTSIGRKGLTMELVTAKDVTLTVAGAPTELTIAGTVSDALTAAGVIGTSLLAAAAGLGVVMAVRLLIAQREPAPAPPGGAR